MQFTRRQVASGMSAFVAALALRGRADAAPSPLFGACQSVEARLSARLGVSVIDTANDIRTSYRGSELFPMCSTFKALAAGAILRRVDAGKESLARRVQVSADQLVTYSPVTKDKTGGAGMTVAELCHAAITVSDNTAANLLLAALGGPTGFTESMRALGDQVTRLDRWETELNAATPGDPRDTTSPDQMAATLRSLAVDTALSETSRTQFNEWLFACTTGTAKLRAGLPRDWRVGDKTGSGSNGTSNDIAVIWPPDRKPVVIAMFITQTTAGMEAINPAFAEIARLTGQS